VSTNEAERQLAAAKYNEALNASLASTTRSKSKSPRRTKRELPSPPKSPPIPAFVPRHTRSAGRQTKHDSLIPSTKESSAFPGAGEKKMKRPHTSAGPRDKPRSFEFADFARDFGIVRIDGEGFPSRRRLDRGLDSSRDNEIPDSAAPFAPAVSTSKVTLGTVIVPQSVDANASNGRTMRTRMRSRQLLWTRYIHGKKS
jgi:hypothetical protein